MLGIAKRMRSDLEKWLHSDADTFKEALDILTQLAEKETKWVARDHGAYIRDIITLPVLAAFYTGAGVYLSKIMPMPYEAVSLAGLSGISFLSINALVGGIRGYRAERKEAHDLRALVSEYNTMTPATTTPN